MKLLGDPDFDHFELAPEKVLANPSRDSHTFQEKAILNKNLLSTTNKMSIITKYSICCKKNIYPKPIEGKP